MPSRRWIQAAPPGYRRSPLPLQCAGQPVRGQRVAWDVRRPLLEGRGRRYHWCRAVSRVAHGAECHGEPHRFADPTLLDGPVAGPLVEHIIGTVLSNQNPARDFPPAFPGQVFAPTTLPAGHGQRHGDRRRPGAEPSTQSKSFSKPSRSSAGWAATCSAPSASPLRAGRPGALLGMNVAPMNCYMEARQLGQPQRPSHSSGRAGTHSMRPTFRTRATGASSTFLDAGHLRAYFGDRVDRWKAASRHAS